MNNSLKVSETDGAIIANNTSKRFVFISDLHFDCIEINSLPDTPPYSSREGLRALFRQMVRQMKAEEFSKIETDNNFLEREDIFIKFVRENFSNDILILAGDYYTNYFQTLSFVKKLEESKIICYFVLGNHDFASDNKTDHEDIIRLFDSETNSHKYCKFLTTGKKFYHEDVCIIGDTGWGLVGQYTHAARGKFSTKHCSKRLLNNVRERWLEFAANTLNLEEKVLIVTHFPQAEIKYSEKHLIDWQSANLFLASDNCWKVFGHTHQRGHFQHFNNVCSQQGYKNNNKSDTLDYIYYSKRDFGTLEKMTAKANNTSFDVVCAFDKISFFYSTKLVQEPEKELEAIKTISRRGFMRAGNKDNKRALAELIYNKEGYISRVKEGLKAVKFTEYIGYVLGEHVSLRVVEAVENAIDILENVNPNNARPFMTALVITAYVYNGMISFIDSMRPVDDYDIIRWWLLLATVQKYNIDPDEIKSVKRNQKECLPFQNVPLYLPKVNDKSLSISEVRVLLSKTDLLPDRLQVHGKNISTTAAHNVSKTEIKPEKIFTEGELVVHKTFGEGKIISAQQVNGNHILEIDFSGVGIKKIMSHFIKAIEI